MLFVTDLFNLYSEYLEGFGHFRVEEKQYADDLVLLRR